MGSLEPMARREVPSLERAAAAADRIRARIRAQVMGRDEVIELVLIALLADGHVLLEDFPGSGKTTLAKALGNAIVDPRSENRLADFRRVQFTPDLLPSDLTGTQIFDAVSSRFHFRPGPLFAHVVLADEINRTSPKVQSAMLEAMAEKQVTVDDQTHALDALFTVIATQNPLDLAGTYPLPVAQLDRFLFKIRMTHIDRASELEVLRSIHERRDLARSDLPQTTRDEILAAREAIETQVRVDPRIHECLVDIAGAIRSDRRVQLGTSTRSLVLALPALQARALLGGRDYVSGEDLEALLPRVLEHRVDPAPGLGEPQEIVEAALAAPIERLARSALRRP
jgi:MoxR-like ATPase